MSVRPHAVGLVVRDMARSLAFYRLAGLAIAEGAEEGPHAEVETGDGWSLGFDTEELVRRFDPTWQAPVGQRLNLQFRCDDAAEVDAVHARLIAAGYPSHTAPWDAPWGQRFARVVDPDGSVVNFFAELGGA